MNLTLLPKIGDPAPAVATTVVDQQVDPMRIPITPFADAPGFTPPKIVVATPTGP